MKKNESARQAVLGIFTILVAVAGILMVNSAYILDETEQAVITQFGKPVGGPVLKPGLNWKIPFLQVVHKFDRRILNWDGYPSEIPTRDKKFIWVDVTGRWRIENPLLFLQTMQSERKAQTRLDDIMDGITRNYITRYDLVEVVRTTNGILESVREDEDAVDTELEKIFVGRDEITRQILKTASEIVKEYGIALIDLRIKRLKYIEQVQEKVFERMISERKRAAEQMRSEGQGVRAEIEGQKEKELKRITSEAYRTAQKLQGEADAEATRIYADAYGKDPEFYSFLGTLERYPGTLDKSRLVLTTSSDFLKYLKETK